MKTYLKNAAFCLLAIGLLLMTWGLLELGKAVIRAQIGVSDSGLSLAVLIIVAGGGAVKTFRDWKKKTAGGRNHFCPAGRCHPETAGKAGCH